MTNFMQVTNPVNLLASDEKIKEEYSWLQDLKKREESGEKLLLTPAQIVKIRSSKYLIDSAIQEGASSCND